MKYQKLFLSFIILVAVVTQQSKSSENPLSTGTVTHVVIIWLKKPGNQADKETLIKRTKGFLKIPGVKSVKVGSPINSQRAVVDSSYDLGVSMEFENLQALRNYDHEPIHQKAVEETLKPLVSKFIVYDFLNE